MHQLMRRLWIITECKMDMCKSTKKNEKRDENHQMIKIERKYTSTLVLRALYKFDSLGDSGKVFHSLGPENLTLF